MLFNPETLEPRLATYADRRGPTESQIQDLAFDIDAVLAHPDTVQTVGDTYKEQSGELALGVRVDSHSGSNVTLPRTQICAAIASGAALIKVEVSALEAPQVWVNRKHITDPTAAHFVGCSVFSLFLSKMAFQSAQESDSQYDIEQTDTVSLVRSFDQVERILAGASPAPVVEPVSPKSNSYFDSLPQVLIAAMSNLRPHKVTDTARRQVEKNGKTVVFARELTGQANGGRPKRSIRVCHSANIDSIELPSSYSRPMLVERGSVSEGGQRRAQTIAGQAAIQDYRQLAASL